MLTLKELREQAKRAYEEKHKEEVIAPIETTGNKGVTVKHSWAPAEAPKATKEEKMAEREANKEAKLEARSDTSDS